MKDYVRQVETTIAENLAADPHFYDDPNAPTPTLSAGYWFSPNDYRLGAVGSNVRFASSSKTTFSRGSNTYGPTAYGPTAYGSNTRWSR